MSADGRLVSFSSLATNLDSRDADPRSDIYVETRGTPANRPPAIRANGPYVGVEGGSVALTASASDPEGRPLVVTWQPDRNLVGSPVSASAQMLAVDDGSVALTASARDGAGNVTSSKTTVRIRNVAPSVDAGSVSGRPGTPVRLTDASASDRGLLDRHTGTVDWGDGTSGSATVQHDLWPTVVGSDRGRGAPATDGRFAVFTSDDPTLVDGDVAGTPDVFLHDTVTGVTTLVSQPSTPYDSDRFVGGGTSCGAGSADGRFAAFVSAASGLVPGVPGGRPLVYQRDVLTRRAVLVSRAADGGLPDAGVNETSGDTDGRCMASSNGRFVAFASAATNLVPSDDNGRVDVFVRDVVAGTTRRLPSVGDDVAAVWSVSDQGQVTWTDEFFGADIEAYSCMLDSHEVRGTGSGFGFGGLCALLSADGRWIAFATTDRNDNPVTHLATWLPG